MAHRIALGDIAGMTSFGTFKPVGYSVLVYASREEADAAAGKLRDLGFGAEDLIVASSRDVFPQMNDKAHLAGESVAAAQGYEVVLMKRYVELAHRGSYWVLCYSPKDDDVAQVKMVYGQTDPQSGAHYGRLLIEDFAPVHRTV